MPFQLRKAGSADLGLERHRCDFEFAQDRIMLSQLAECRVPNGVCVLRHIAFHVRILTAKGKGA